MQLANNTILITGGNSGYGLELAREFIKKNNKVIICGRSQNKLDLVKKANPKIETFRGDVSSKEDRMKLYRFIKDEHPELNLLINNAAITSSVDFLSDSDVIKIAKDSPPLLL